MRYTSIWAGIFALASSLLFYAAGEGFIALLTTLPEVRTEAAGYLIWLILLPLPAVWAFQFDGIFIGTTQIRRLRNAMFFSFLAYLAVVWLTQDALGNHGIWLAMLVFMGARAALLAAQYPAVARSVRSSGVSASAGS